MSFHPIHSFNKEVLHPCCVPGTGVTVGTALNEMRGKHPIILALMELMVYQETDNKQDKQAK